MKRISFIFILSVLVFSMVSVAGCAPEPQFICANGKVTTIKDECGINKVAAVRQNDAETYAKRYVSAYFTPYGGKAQLVSAYLNPDEGDYYATFIVSEKDGTPYETVVKIEGLTGKVSCETFCAYLE